jgi:hypothetical protein
VANLDWTGTICGDLLEVKQSEESEEDIDDRGDIWGTWKRGEDSIGCGQPAG